MKRFAVSAALAAFFVASCQTASAPIAPIAEIRAAQGERVRDWPSEESDLRPDPNVRYGKLPNGMRYAIRANRNPTNAVSFRLRFDVGSLMEDDDQRGLAHFLEHMAFNGSANVPEGEMMPLLQRRGLSFGAHTNAYTSFDETVYMLEAPNVEAETLNTVFMLLRETASNLTIAPEAVDRERGVILSEERARNSPQLRAAQAEWDALYPNARFQERMPIGTVEVIRNAPAQRLRDLYEAYYRPERAFFVVSGDIDPDAMEAKIREAFGDWRPARADPGDPDLGDASGGAEAAYFYDPGLSTTISLAAPRPAANEANTRAQVRRSFLNGIGVNIVSRRLTRLARAPGARFQQGQAGDNELYGTLDVASVQLASQAEDWQAALSVGEQEIRRAVQFGFTQAEIDEQIARTRTAFRTAAERAATRTSSQLADEMVGEFSNWGVDMDPSDELALIEALIPEFTAQNVHAAFRQLWGGETRLFVSSGARIENAPDEMVAAFAESRRTPVEAPQAQTLAQFAYTSFGQPGAIAEQGEIADLGITTVRFANNVRLNLKHTDFTDNAIFVSVRFGAGVLELPADRPGLAMLMQSLAEGGLEAHSADELQSILTGRNVRTQIGADDDAFTLAGATTPEDLQIQLQVMAAYLAHPGYRAEAEERFRQTVTSQYQTIAASPNGVAQRDVPRLLRSGDQRYGIPPLEQLTARSFSELRQTLLRASSRGAIEIGIVGDIDIERTIGLVASTFGALPAREATDPAFTEARRVAFPEGARQARVLRHEGQTNRAMALTYWPTIDDTNAREMRTVELLRAVMSLKLIDRIRESEGATYSPSAQASFSHANPGYGFMGVSLDLEPANVNRFFGIVDEIAASLAAGDITADELERARRPIIDQFRNDQEDNGYWYGLVATAQTNPNGLAQHRSAIADYSAVTIADLRAAARRYLVANRAYRVAIMPSEAQNQ